MKLRMRSAQRRRSQGGNTLVEGAMCFLAFMTLMLGVMEFSLAVYAYNFVSASAREASRYASVHGSQSDHPVDQSELQTWVRGRAVGLTTSSITVALSWNPANDNNPGSEAIVRVSYDVLPMVGLVLRPITVAGLSKSVISH